MKVNKNSWHYKLMEYFKFDIISDLRYGSSVTLCRYFWNAVGSILMSLIGIGGAILMTGAITFLFCMLILAPISYLTIAYFGFGWHEVSDVGVVMIWLFWVAFPLLVGLERTYTGNMKVFPNWMKIKLLPPAASSKPNILVEYVKAKKNKFCPLVELDKE